MLDMEGSVTCSWKSNICPHRLYNFTTTTEKSKVEGRQLRFLGLILGMNPLSALRASGQIAKPFRNGPHYDQIQYWSGTREINRYRAVMNVKNTVDIYEFLHLLEVLWHGDETPHMYHGKPTDRNEFQKFADRVEKRFSLYCYDREEGVDTAYLKRHLMKNWYRFRELGRRFMKNGWYLTDLWKVYKEFQKKNLFSEKITAVTILTQLKQPRRNRKKDGTARATRTCK